jgi:hypothetical protein
VKPDYRAAAVPTAAQGDADAGAAYIYSELTGGNRSSAFIHPNR